MKRAILHIGTEKTGSTSIQQFLFANRERLDRDGRLFPASAGYLSNHKLVVWAKERPEDDIVAMATGDSGAESLADWKDGFVVDHCNEVLPWLAARRRGATVIYSSEHLQSRLVAASEIRRVGRLLRPMYDRIEVVVYLRRQDRYAMSAHGTSVRAGELRPFDFSTVHGGGPYYDYLALLQKWAAVFGDEAMTVRVFEPARLVGGDVVADFVELAGLGTRWPRSPYALPESENGALSLSAEAALRTFNALDPGDPRHGGEDPAALRRYLVAALQGHEDGLARPKPSRAAALEFYEPFREPNAELARRWLGGRGFDERFDDYPESAREACAAPDGEALLDTLLARRRQATGAAPGAGSGAEAGADAGA